jgi:hypothetical protein
MHSQRRLSYRHFGWVTAVAASLSLACLPACKHGPGSSSLSAKIDGRSNNKAARKMSGSANILMDDMKDPKAPFHFAYKGQQNVNDRFPLDKNAKPEMGPVTIAADLTSEEIDISEVRGDKKRETKAMKPNQLDWSMAQLSLIGALTSPSFAMAVGSPVASNAGSDSAGGTSCDKYVFDTTTAAGSQKAGLEIAKSMLTNIKDAKGTVWVAQNTGRLTKFNIDVDYADKSGNAWTEHYEGEVTPK